MQADAKKCVSVTVPRTQVHALRAALAMIGHDEITVRPVISGWSHRAGCLRIERTISKVGEHVEVSFTADEAQIGPMVAAGIGIVAGQIVQLRVSDVAAS